MLLGLISKLARGKLGFDRQKFKIDHKLSRMFKVGGGNRAGISRTPTEDSALLYRLPSDSSSDPISTLTTTKGQGKVEKEPEPETQRPP